LALAAVEPVAQPQPVVAADHLRRCTYRRLIAVQRKPVLVYDVECLYPDRQLPLPLGDLDSARPICERCTAPHIFRPDED
jgi:hypothetical protein